VAAGPSPAEKAAQDAQLAAEAQRLKDQEELARLRAENEQRLKADQEAAQRKQIEEETRRKIEAEIADKKRREDEARQKADAASAEKKRQEVDAQQKADAEGAARQQAEATQKAAEGSEASLRLTTVDRQHIQVALTALGFNTRGADGVFGTLTRDMIAAWQKARGAAPTGFVTSDENQALLKEAAQAVSRFDEERKRATKMVADENERAGTTPPRASPPPLAPPLSTSGASSLPVIVQSEPSSGSLPRGQVILVDDGTCPASQIKEVTGGSGNQRVQRTRRCIPRPKN
jgi:peptidoglycan hydrolase-like protein with peptidoglycan-binding domain